MNNSNFRRSERSRYESNGNRMIDQMNLLRKFDVYGQIADYGGTKLDKITGIHAADLDNDGDLDVLVHTDTQIHALENQLYQKAGKE